VPDISEEQEGDGADDDGLSMDDLKETMLGMVEGKLATLLGKSSGYIESLPVEIKLNVEGLKGLQVKQNELHQKYKLECLELEKKVSLLTSTFFVLSLRYRWCTIIIAMQHACFPDQEEDACYQTSLLFFSLYGLEFPFQ
jgi:hypothetical protein